MKQYKVTALETIKLEFLVEANSEEEARKIVIDGDCSDSVEVDTTDFEIEDVEEIEPSDDVAEDDEKLDKFLEDADSKKDGELDPWLKFIMDKVRD